MIRRTAAAALAASLLLATAGWSQSLSAFGADGELIEVVEGRYADLFGEGAQALPDSLVLALQVTQPGGEPDLFLIPGSEDPEEDRPWALVGDDSQRFILWSSVNDLGESRLNLIGHDGTTWTELIEVSGDPSLRKGHPRLTVTRDSYGSSVLSEARTVAHLLWWEETPSGETAVRYSPIVFVGSHYLGWNPVVDLGQFDTNPDAEDEGPEISEALLHAASLDSGADVRSVVAALPRHRSGRLLTLQMRVLPEPLLKVANDVRAHIVLIGRAAESRESILRMADEVRAHIVLIGRMHRGVREYIAEKTYAALLSYGASFVPEEAEKIADLGWLSVIESGASILGNGLREGNLPCSILFLGTDPTKMVGSPHQLEICLTSDRPAPETEPERRHTIFVSQTGDEALVTWEGPDGSVNFRESLEAGWSEVQTVNSGGLVTREQALRMLRQTVRVD